MASSGCCPEEIVGSKHNRSAEHHTAPGVGDGTILEGGKAYGRSDGTGTGRRVPGDRDANRAGTATPLRDTPGRASSGRCHGADTDRRDTHVNRPIDLQVGPLREALAPVSFITKEWSLLLVHKPELGMRYDIRPFEPVRLSVLIHCPPKGVFGSLCPIDTIVHRCL